MIPPGTAAGCRWNPAAAAHRPACRGHMGGFWKSRTAYGGGARTRHMGSVSTSREMLRAVCGLQAAGAGQQPLGKQQGCASWQRTRAVKGSIASAPGGQGALLKVLCRVAVALVLECLHRKVDVFALQSKIQEKGVTPLQSDLWQYARSRCTECAPLVLRRLQDQFVCDTL